MSKLSNYKKDRCILTLRGRDKRELKEKVIQREIKREKNKYI